MLEKVIAALQEAAGGPFTLAEFEALSAAEQAAIIAGAAAALSAADVLALVGGTLVLASLIGVLVSCWKKG